MKVSTSALSLISVLAAFAAVPAQAQNLTDTDILNFALNLEYLEAEFYSWAVNGAGISASLRGGGPASTGGMKANLTQPIAAYAAELARDELDHVRFLRTALGALAVAMPAINIGTAFAAAANAAFNKTLSPAFNPYANDLFFLHGAFIFEDVGVTAYKGAAALITNKNFLTPVAGILAVEAYHAGSVRSKLFKMYNTTTPYGVNVETIVRNIAVLRATASNTTEQGLVLNGMPNLVPANTATSIAFSRTPAQVVSIVTLGSMNGTGGFFPEGLSM
jgi:hypothetical protein